MSSKIEDVFDLPPMNEEANEPIQQQETGLDLSQLQQQLDTADKIDAALPMVRDMETLDADMDNYANKAIHAFQDLMDLGQNVEDRHAANVFAVASTMMSNAITAKTAKMDKKLKMVQLQLQKAKFDAAENKANGNDTVIQGEAEEFEDRNALISAVINKMNNSDK